jgi:hypothetical protein
MSTTFSCDIARAVSRRRDDAAREPEACGAGPARTLHTTARAFVPELFFFGGAMTKQDKAPDIRATLRRAVNAAAADIDARLKRGEHVKSLEVRRLLDLCNELDLHDQFERTKELMTE